MPTKRPAKSEALALRRMEQSIPPEDFRSVLAMSGDKRVQHLLQMMTSPEFSKWKLPAMCERAGLYYDEVLLMLTRGRVGDGIEKMSRHAPKVFDDIGVDAESRLIPCPECKGEGSKTVGRGKHAESVECWVCEGKKKIRKSGDAESREFMLKALKVIDNPKAGTNVQVNVNGAGLASVEDDLELTGEVIDVSVAPQTE